MLLVAGATAACAYKVVRAHRLHPAAVENLLTKVERIRQLKATRPLRVSLEGRHRLAHAGKSDLHRVSYLSHMEDLAQAWSKVGLIPWGTDLAAAFTSVGSEAPAGYYDTADGILRIIDRNTPRSEIMELAGLARQRDLVDGEVLAHEITHALQDMNFDLGQFLNDAPTDDAALARRCLAEGDASFVGYQYSAVFTPGLESWLRFVENRVEALDVRGAPDFVNRRFQLPYLQGARFVGLLQKKGGWRAVNAAYADPPASTEEILHPDRFLNGRDRPVDIRLPPLGPFLPPGSRALWEDAVGELGLRVVFQRERPRGQAASRPTPTVAAEGWDGDRAAIHKTPGGGLTLVWKMAFDSPQDAMEAFVAYRAMMQRYPGFALRRGLPELVEATAGSSGLWLQRLEDRLLVMEGIAPARQQKAAAAVLAHPDGKAFDAPAGAQTDGGARQDAGAVDAGGADAGAADGGADTDASTGGP